MLRIEWRDQYETAINDEPTTHVIARIQVGFDFYFFIDTDKKTIEREMDSIFKALPKENKDALINVTGEMSRVTNSMFLLRINPLNLFCSLITEIGAIDEKPH
jgi:hypothetical protein